MWEEEGRRQCGDLESGVWTSFRHLSGHVEQAVGLDLRTVILAKDVALGKLERILKMEVRVSILKI